MLRLLKKISSTDIWLVQSPFRCTAGARLRLPHMCTNLALSIDISRARCLTTVKEGTQRMMKPIGSVSVSWRRSVEADDVPFCASDYCYGYVL